MQNEPTEPIWTDVYADLDAKEEADGDWGDNP
jgi:hypothetical protein